MKALMRELALEAIALTELERVGCLDLAFRVFDRFSDWTTELLAFAKSALAHRTVPHNMRAADRRDGVYLHGRCADEH